MSEFSPVDAALEGFRLTRENPVGLAVWTVVLFVVTLLGGYVLIRTGAAEAIAEFYEMIMAPPEASADPAEAAGAMSAAMARAMPGMLMTTIPLIVVQMIIRSAILRTALRAGEERAYLRFGMDEVRVLGAFVLVLAMTMLAGLVVSLGAMVLAALVPSLGIFLGFVGMLAVSVFINTRFLLIYPQAIAERALRPAEAWQMTKGRFRPVFGAMALAYLFYFIVQLLGSVIARAIRAVAGIDPTSARLTMELLLHPGEIAAGALTALLQALGLILIAAPAAAIYRSIRGRGPSEAF